MPTRRQSDPELPASGRRPATTFEDREKQLIAAAVDRAEQQLRDGTASAQVITHYLKLGSTREKLEQKRLEQENLLLAAKTKQIAEAEDIKALYAKAIKALRRYRGEDSLEQDDYDDDDSLEEYDD